MPHPPTACITDVLEARWGVSLTYMRGEAAAGKIDNNHAEAEEDEGWSITVVTV